MSEQGGTDRRITDTAGAPWQGRTFAHHDTAYSDDDGSIPPEFAEAMRALRASGANAVADGSLEAAVQSLAGARLLVPLVTDGTDGPVNTHELAIPTVQAPDGGGILPVFSNVDAMRAWQAQARPVPASIERVAAAALEEPQPRVVIDPGAKTELVLLAPALRALLAGEGWQHPVAREDVGAAFLEAATRVGGVTALALVPGDPQARLAAEEVLCVLVSRDHDATREGLPQFAGLLQQAPAVALHVGSLRVAITQVPETGLDATFPPGTRVATLGVAG